MEDAYLSRLRIPKDPCDGMTDSIHCNPLALGVKALHSTPERSSGATGGQRSRMPLLKKMCKICNLV